MSEVAPDGGASAAAPSSAAPDPASPPNHAARRAAVAADVADAGLDWLLVTHLPNVCYLTGFTGSSGAVLLGSGGEARFATDGRYAVQADEQVGALATTIARGDDWLGQAVPAGARLGLESHRVSWDRARDLAARLDGREVVPAGEVVEPRRAVKDDGELARLRAAAAATDAAFADLAAWLADMTFPEPDSAPRSAPGAGHVAAGSAEAVTEVRVARQLDDRLVAHGADGPAFPTIVAAGEHGARPHHQPTDRPLRHGDLVTVDGGARRHGYCADMTRLVAVGGLTAVDGRLADAVAALTAAQQAGVSTAGDGVAAHEVDAACRSTLAAADLAEAFAHGTGHGIGLEVHEAPRVAASSAATLMANMVCTVEPGVYLPGIGGARIEDVVAVTADGAERLTTTPRDVIAV